MEAGLRWEDRIEVNPQVLLGKPVVKGTRLAVEFVIDLLAQGWSDEEILRNYPHLSREDIHACLAYAGNRLRSEMVYPLTSAFRSTFTAHPSGPRRPHTIQ